MFRTILVVLGVALVLGAAYLLFFMGDEGATPDRADATSTDFVTVLPESSDVAVEEQPIIESPEDETIATVIADEETPASVDSPDAPVPDPGPGFAVDGTITTDEYPNRTDIAGVAVYWANNAELLRIGLVSPGTGYVSIGFDPDDRMQGANYILGSMHEGEVFTRDDFGTEPTAHMPDSDRGGADNILSAAGTEWADQTVLEFVIPLDSGDPMDKPLLPGGIYNVLVAYHSVSDSFSQRHSRRGQGQIRLDTAR